MKATKHQKRSDTPKSQTSCALVSDEIIAFTECVREGSMSAAAQKLSIRPGNVSKAIARLEHRLQVSLLRRNTRQMTLTSAGEAFYEKAIGILEQIQFAESMASWSPGAPKGTVTLAATNHVGSSILGPNLKVFLKSYPGISLRVEAYDDRDQNLIKAPVDMKILTAAVPPENAVRLALSPRYLFASEHYCATQGRPRHPEDLKQHRLLGQTGTTWHLDGAVFYALKVKNLVTTNDIGTLQAAVKAGLGIALVSPIGLAEEIAAGTVKRLLPEFQGPAESFWAVTGPACLPAADLVLNYVKDIFAKIHLFCRDLAREEAFPT